MIVILLHRCLTCTVPLLNSSINTIISCCVLLTSICFHKYKNALALRLQVILSPLCGYCCDIALRQSSAHSSTKFTFLCSATQTLNYNIAYPGIPYWKGRLNTPDLLVLTGLKDQPILIFQTLFTFYYPHEEVNCTGPFPSVSIPWFIPAAISNRADSAGDPKLRKSV